MISVAATRKVARLTSMRTAYVPKRSVFPELFALVTPRANVLHRQPPALGSRNQVTRFLGMGARTAGSASTVAMRSAASQTSTKLV